MSHHRVCSRGKVLRIISLAKGGGCAPPQPPRFCKNHPCLPQNNHISIIIMAVGGGSADHHNDRNNTSVIMTIFIMSCYYYYCYYYYDYDYDEEQKGGLLGGIPIY